MTLILEQNLGQVFPDHHEQLVLPDLSDLAYLPDQADLPDLPYLPDLLDLAELPDLADLPDDQDGSWDGMIEQLKNKKADIALGSLRYEELFPLLKVIFMILPTLFFMVLYLLLLHSSPLQGSSTLSPSSPLVPSTS